MIISNKIMTIIAVTLRDRIKSRIRQNQIKPESDNQGTTLVQSSRLMRSIVYKVDAHKIIIGSSLKYARIQHEGGVIKPKNAKFLAIPLQKIAKVKSPREFKNTFINSGVIFQNQKDGKIVPLYALKKSVTLPPRPYMFVTQGDQNIVINRITPLLNQELEKELK